MSGPVITSIKAFSRSVIAGSKSLRGAIRPGANGSGLTIVCCIYALGLTEIRGIDASGSSKVLAAKALRLTVICCVYALGSAIIPCIKSLSSAIISRIKALRLAIICRIYALGSAIIPCIKSLSSAIISRIKALRLAIICRIYALSGGVIFAVKPCGSAVHSSIDSIGFTKFGSINRSGLTVAIWIDASCLPISSRIDAACLSKAAALNVAGCCIICRIWAVIQFFGRGNGSLKIGQIGIEWGRKDFACLINALQTKVGKTRLNFLLRSERGLRIWCQGLRDRRLRATTRIIGVLVPRYGLIAVRADNVGIA